MGKKILGKGKRGRPVNPNSQRQLVKKATEQLMNKNNNDAKIEALQAPPAKDSSTPDELQNINNLEVHNSNNDAIINADMNNETELTDNAPAVENEAIEATNTATDTPPIEPPVIEDTPPIEPPVTINEAKSAAEFVDLSDILNHIPTTPKDTTPPVAEAVPAEGNEYFREATPVEQLAEQQATAERAQADIPIGMREAENEQVEMTMKPEETADMFINMVDMLQKKLLPSLYESQLLTSKERFKLKVITGQIPMDDIFEPSEMAEDGTVEMKQRKLYSTEEKKYLLNRWKEIDALQAAVPFTAEEKQTMKTPLTMVLRNRGVKMSPEVALIIAVFTIMVPRALPFIMKYFESSPLEF